LLAGAIIIILAIRNPDECLRAFEDSEAFDRYRRLDLEWPRRKKEMHAMTQCTPLIFTYRFGDNAYQLRKIISAFFFLRISGVHVRLRQFDYIIRHIFCIKEAIRWREKSQEIKPQQI